MFKYQVTDPSAMTVFTTNNGEKVKHTITLVPRKSYEFARKSSILITVQDLMRENFIFGSNFRLHEYYNVDISFEPPPQEAGQSDEDYEAYVHDIFQLFKLYLDAVNHDKVYDYSEFHHYHCYRAKLHEIDGNFDIALSDYNLAIEGTQTLPDSFFGKGKVLLHIGKTEEALKQFEIALDVAEGYFNFGAFYYKKVESTINDFLDQNPKSKSRSRVQEWLTSTRKSYLVKNHTRT